MNYSDSLFIFAVHIRSHHWIGDSLCVDEYRDYKGLRQWPKQQMIDAYTFEQCKKDKEIRQLKIKNLEHAIYQSEAMIAESQMDGDALTFLRRKVAASRQDLEVLYLMNDQE